jgi:hypothetical protein
MARTKQAATDAEESTLLRLLTFSRTTRGRVLRSTLLAALVLLVVSIVLRQARAAVDRLPTYRLGSATLRFVDLPPWVDARMRAQLEGRRSLDRIGSLAALRTFDPDVERRLKEALARHPMLQSVHEVDVRFPDEIRVRADVRTPIALVRIRGVGTRAGFALGSLDWFAGTSSGPSATGDGPFTSEVGVVLVLVA